MSGTPEKPDADLIKDESGGETPATAGFSDYRRIFHYCDGLGWTLNAIALVATSGSGAMLPIMDLVFGKFVNTFNGFTTGELDPSYFQSQIDKYTLWFVYLFIAKFAGVYIWTLCLSISGLRTTKALRIHFLERTLRQDIPFFDQPDNGSISSQISTNGNLVSMGIGEKLGLFFQGLATFIAAFAVAFAVQWKLTLITLSIVPTIIIVVSICIGFATKIENESLSLYSRAGQLAEEAFASIANVHAFWAQPKLGAMYETYLSKAKVVQWKLCPIYGVLFSTEFFCVFAGYALSFWQGVHMYANGEIKQPGQVVTVLFAVILAATSLTQIAPQIMALSKASGAAAALFKIMDRQPEVDAMDTKGECPAEVQGDIRLRAVQFAYPQRPDTKIFNGFDLHIPAGKTTALVGPSGSGKSTIVGLLERWYVPASGTIAFDGRPLDQLNIQWLRSNVRLVQQEPTIFNATVEENIKLGLLGTPSADLSADKQMQLVEAACKAAYAHEFIEQLPEGYRTEVGQRGARLSGGQKQRLAIARAIVANPKVLLLDEATSALDPKAERIVQEALDNVSTGRTTLVIAHKLSTVRKADNIAVINKGNVVEQGTHDELIKLDGAYARLVRTQDLEQGHGEIKREDNEEKPSLVRAVTSKSVGQHGESADQELTQTLNYNLLRCIWIMGKEQPELYIYFLITLFFSFTAGGTFPALAIVFSKVINVFTYSTDRMLERGDFFALMFFVIALNNLISYFAIGWIANIISQTLTYKYRLEIFANLVKQDRAFFDQAENTTGALGSNLTTKPTSLQELFGFNLMLILIGIINLVSSSVLGIIVGWKLGLVITFGALPPIVLCGFLRIRLEFKLEADVDRRFSDSTAIASEAVAAIRTVASLTLERHIQARYVSALSAIERTTFKALVWTMFWYALCSSISFLGMALGFWYGGRLMSTGEYTSEQFFVVFVAIIFAGEATAQFFSYSTSITKGHSGANYLLWLRTLTPTMRDTEVESKGDSDDDEKSAKSEATIRCEELDFSYPLRPDAKVIRNVDIDVPSGQSVALVGPSGCGKSTMIALLERFYDPLSGKVTYNGTNIATMNPRSYRRNLALVEQEPTLYRMSIRENIALGLEGEATDEQIIDACRAANIYDFISSLPDGLATLCGPNGTQLSGGQKQRVAISRALIRDPKVLLLDEATSALDSESEKVVQGALRDAASQRTTITVAHRLSTIKDADCIYVFLKGRIEESGTHKELLDRKGMYYDMCLGQSLERSV